MHRGLAEREGMHILQIAEIVLVALQLLLELFNGHVFQFLSHTVNYNRENFPSSTEKYRRPIGLESISQPFVIMVPGQ
jgi:hypothetical protein